MSTAGVEPTCSIPECNKPRKARGWCAAHWWRWRKHGDPLGAHEPDDETRFLANVTKTSGCWAWKAYKNPDGYGMFSYKGKPSLASRVSWTLFVGDIPDGLFIDHRCRNRSCVNPRHLRVVTRKQNGEHVDVRHGNKSGYRGVFFEKQRMKWCVRVRHHGRAYHGGFFDDVHEAGKAAKSLRNELFTHNDLDRKAA